MRWITCVAVMPLFAAANVSALAADDEAIDRMTCQQARNFVARTGHYDINTRGGQTIPIDVRSLAQGPSCGPKMSVWQDIERTKDNPQCFVGWSCNTGS
jgi:hypothetical protein